MEDPHSTNFLVIKLIGCKGLKSFNFFQKLTVYALVSIDSPAQPPEDHRKLEQQQRTPTDKEGGGNPEWNHQIRFDISQFAASSSSPGGGDEDDEKLPFLRFDLRDEVALFADRTIGEVRVPLKDLMEESNDVVRFLSYQVRTADGKPNGVLNFSCKFDGTDRSRRPPIKEEGVEEEGRVHYPTLDVLEDLQSQPHQTSNFSPPAPPQAYYPPPPPPPGYYPAPVACAAGTLGGGHYQYPVAVRPHGGRVGFQEPWGPPDPFRYGDGGAFDYYNNYYRGGGGGATGIPPWSPRS